MNFNPQLWIAQRQLNARSPETRLRTVQKLRQQAHTAARELLVQALQDSDPQVRAEVASALGEKKEARNIPPLLQALRDSSEDVQEAAIQALKRIGDQEAVDALVDAMNRGSSKVQWSAAQALKAFGWQPGNPTEELQFCIAMGELQRAASFGPPAVAPLAKVLREGTYQQRVIAANVLGEMASLAVLKPLLAAMKDGDSLVRAAAAEALSRQQGAEAVAGLVKGLKDPEPKVRAAAAIALSRLGQEEAVPPLIGALGDKEWLVRAEALEALGRLGFRSALEAVTARLSDPDVEVRQKAADAVSLLGDEQSIAVLLPNLVDLDPGVRQATLRSLNRISPNWERAGCVQAMVGKLQAATRHGDSGVQYAAVTLLKRITGLTVSELTQATEKTRAERQHQLKVRILSDLLRDRNAQVRLAAAEMVAQLRLAHCADALRQGLQDPDHWVQMAVRDALKALPMPHSQTRT